MVSVAALWVYDYFLTVCDEVAESPNGNGTRDLTTLYRSATRGRRRALLVREPWHLSRSALTNNISALVLFLFVSTFHCRRHVGPNRRSDQVPSTGVPGVVRFL
jgi:hypothetical protein